MVQQLMREGNMRRRLRKASPMGLMARTTCRFSFTRSRKKLNMDSGVASILRPWERRGEREGGRRRERESIDSMHYRRWRYALYCKRVLKVQLSSHLCPCSDLHLLNDLCLLVRGK